MPEKNYRIGERMIHIWIPDDVHRRLRLAAAEGDTTMQELVSGLIADAVKAKRGGKRK